MTHRFAGWDDLTGARKFVSGSTLFISLLPEQSIKAGSRLNIQPIFTFGIGNRIYSYEMQAREALRDP
jgi:hypothetical protein